jgi:HrpA-like RNA helicase
MTNTLFELLFHSFYIYIYYRKIILATNIAESSITIDDVVYVIDCGKAKETSYDALNKLACLLPSWISKASAHQVCYCWQYNQSLQ